MPTTLFTVSGNYAKWHMKRNWQLSSPTDKAIAKN